MEYEYDLIVVGGGSGGCSTAIRATDLGLKVLIVEKRPQGGVGGTCINRGCIPTKALIRAVASLDEVKRAGEFGIKVEGYSVDIKKIMTRRAKIQNQLVFGLRTFILGGRKIPVMFGAGSLTDAHTVRITPEKGEPSEHTAKYIMIATGSEPAMIPQFNIDRENILTSDETLKLDYVPESLLIVGGGHIGIEMGTFYSAMGSKVTIVEALPDIASALNDQDGCDMARKLVEKRGIEVKTGVMIEKLEVTGENEVTAFLTGGEKLTAQKALVAIGRTCNIAGLGLEGLGVDINRGRIVTDERMRTNVESIFAIGDVAPGAQLSSKSQNEGVTAAEIMAGNEIRLDYSVMPWTIFARPEMTKVGISEKEAREAGKDIIVGKLMMTANEKAVCNSETDGMVKLVADRATRKILGGMIICDCASNMIGEVAAAMRGGLTIDELACTVHSHPTYSEAILECARNAIGKAYHK
jgi:dihydrolipoamide dehydrogenase